MKTTLAAGLEIDLLTRDEVHDVVKQALREQHQPGYLKLGDVGVMPASGILWLDLGGPPDGFAWDVRKVAVAGNDPTSAITGKVILYGSRPLTYSTQDATTISTDFEDAAGAIPAIFTYSKDQLKLFAPDHLVLAISGVTQNQQVIAIARVVQSPFNVREQYTV